MRCRGGWLHKIVNSSPGLQQLLQPAHLSPGASSWGILHPDYLKTARKHNNFTVNAGKNKCEQYASAKIAAIAAYFISFYFLSQSHTIRQQLV